LTSAFLAPRNSRLLSRPDPLLPLLPLRHHLALVGVIRHTCPGSAPPASLHPRSLLNALISTCLLDNLPFPVCSALDNLACLQHIAGARRKRASRSKAWGRRTRLRLARRRSIPAILAPPGAPGGSQPQPKTRVLRCLADPLFLPNHRTPNTVSQALNPKPQTPNPEDPKSKGRSRTALGVRFARGQA
jgi:hypothetical protein